MPESAPSQIYTDFAGAHTAPKDWQDVASDFGTMYVEVLKEAPFWLNISLILLFAFCVTAILVFRYYRAKLQHANRNEGQNVPMDALIQVITESSAQSASSATIIQELVDQLSDVGDSMKSFSSQMKSVTLFSEELAKLVEDVAESVNGMTEQLHSMGEVSKSLDKTVIEVKEMMAGCSLKCIHQDPDIEGKKRHRH